MPFYFGDSIAGLLHGNNGGSGSLRNNASGFTLVGASPSKILSNISLLTPSQIDQMRSTGVVLSSGTNNTKDQKSTLDVIRELIRLGVSADNITVTNINKNVPGSAAYNDAISKESGNIGFNIADISGARADSSGHPNINQYRQAVSGNQPKNLPFDPLDTNNPFDRPAPPDPQHYQPSRESGGQEDWIRDYWNQFDPSQVVDQWAHPPQVPTFTPWRLSGDELPPDSLFSPSDLISQQYRPTTDDSYNEGPSHVYPNTPDDAYNQSPDYVPYDSYPETPPETYDNQPDYVQPDYSEYPDYVDQPGNIPPPPMEFMSPAGRQPSRSTQPPSVYGGHGIANPNAPTIQVGIRNPTGTPGGGAPAGGAGQLSTMNWANSLPSISNFYNNLGFAPGGGGYITQFIDALQQQGAPQTNSNSPGGFSPIPVELAPGGVSEEQFATWMASGGGGNSLAQLLNPPRQA